MTAYLLDTNVLSEVRRPRPNAAVVAFLSDKAAESLYVSDVTIAEIRFGIERLDDPLRRAELTDWLDHRLRPEFEGRILTIDEDVLLRWRLLVEEGRRIGHTFSQPDLFLAATALHHGLVLVTRNTADFQKTKVPLVDPWAAPSP